MALNKPLLFTGIGSLFAVLGVVLSPSRRGEELKTSYPGPACPPSGTRLLFVGDSYAVGLSPHLKAKAGGCGISWHYSAQEGSNITKWASWIGSLLASSHPTHVLFSQGGNDFGRSDAQKVQADFESFVKQIKGAGAVPMWIEPPTTPFPDSVGAREIFGATLWAHPGYEIDSRELDIPRAPGDSLGHPTADGYKKWAEWIWPWFTERAGR